MFISNSHFLGQDGNGLQLKVQNKGYDKRNFSIHVSNCTFMSWNKALEVDISRLDYSGPYAVLQFYVDIVDASFSKNKQGVFLHRAPVGSMDIRVSNSIFAENIGEYRAAVSSVSLVEPGFGLGNIAAGFPVAFYTESFPSLEAQGENISIIYNSITIINSKFLNNRGLQGGAVNINCSVSITYVHVDIRNSKFLENTALDSGGGEACHNCRVSIENSQFDNNVAKANGGAITCTKFNQKLDPKNKLQMEAGIVEDSLLPRVLNILNITSCTFKGNKAKFHGGAIYSEYQTLVGRQYFTKQEYIPSVFIINLAGRDGGAIPEAHNN